MASAESKTADDIIHEFRFFRVHKDGRVTLRFPHSPNVPPSEDHPINGVRSKDVIISADPRVTARVFLPAGPGVKLPVLLYVHGGGFCMQSPFTRTYNDFVATVAGASGAVAVSIDYGLFPARPMPACYDDSWAALRWIAGHAGGAGPEPWLNSHADLGRVFIAGDSAGGNMTHDLVTRVGRVGLPGLTVTGACLIHPYFGGTEDDHMVMYMFPGNKGTGDPRISPAAEDLAGIGCGKVLVFVAEKDSLVGPGKRYAEDLRESGWEGTVEIVESLGEDHCFLFINKDPKYDKTVELVNKFVDFIKDEN